MFTLTSMLNRTARLHGARPAIIDAVNSFNWAQFTDRISRAASVLVSMGIHRGDRYGIIAPNSSQYAELICAGYWMGAVPVPVNHRFAPPEIAYVLEDAACSLVIIDEIYCSMFDEAVLQSWAANLLVMSATGSGVAQASYDRLVESASSLEVHDAAPGDEALLLYTGGTTGRAKGVPLSHLNIMANAMQLGFELGPRDDDIYLHVAPMFHSADLLATPYFIAGAGHVYLPGFSPSAVLEAIQAYGVTVVLMTPTMLVMTMQVPEFKDYDLSSLKQIIYGSSPISVERIKEMLGRFPGVDATQAYGLTETSPILTILPMRDHQLALNTNADLLLKSVGRSLPGVDIRIVDDAGTEQTTGEAGEIAVRGPNVAKAYLNRPGATAEAFKSGWFRTGDIGRLDAEGYLYLLDRKKDMIITGGEMVFSSEVEAVLHQNPKVHECAVIGVPDDTYGEALLGVVVPAHGETLSAEELIAHCRGKIGGYKIPRRYVFPDELPKSAIDKVLKTELRRVHGGKS